MNGFCNICAIFYGVRGYFEISVFNPIALRMAKTLWSFGHSECNSVHSECNSVHRVLAILSAIVSIEFWSF